MKLLAHRRPPPKSVVGILESLLERARKGEIRSVAVAYVLIDEAETATSYEIGLGKRTWGSTLVGAVARLQHALLRHLEDVNE